jgi:hypothetical protein
MIYLKIQRCSWESKCIDRKIDCEENILDWTTDNTRSIRYWFYKFWNLNWYETCTIIKTISLKRFDISKKNDRKKGRASWKASIWN